MAERQHTEHAGQRRAKGGNVAAGAGGRGDDLRPDRGRGGRADSRQDVRRRVADLAPRRACARAAKCASRAAFSAASPT